MHLSDRAIERPRLIILGAIVLCAMGLAAIFTLPKEREPRIRLPVVLAVIQNPGGQPITNDTQKPAFFWVRVDGKKRFFSLESLDPLPQGFDEIFSAQIVLIKAGKVIIVTGLTSLVLDGLHHLIQRCDGIRGFSCLGAFIGNDGGNTTAQNVWLDGEKNDGPAGDTGRAAAPKDVRYQ